MADECSGTIVIQHEIINIVKKKLKIKILVQSEMKFNLVISNESTTERRLMIDTKAARRE